MIPFDNHKGEKIKTNEKSLRYLQETIKHTNIHVIGITEEVREKEAEKLLEKIKALNVPTSMRNINLHIQKPNELIADKPKEVHSPPLFLIIVKLS